MTQSVDTDHWAGARRSMETLERSATRISRTGFAGATALTAAVALLITLGLLLNLNLTRTRESFSWTRHADAIFLELAGLQQSLLQGEANTRAFALNGDASNIALLKRAHREMRAHRSALAALVADNAQQTRALGVLADFIEARFGRLEWFVALGPEERRARITDTSASAAALRVQQRRLSDAIDTGIGRFRAAENKLLAERRGTAEADIGALNFMVLGLAVAAPLLTVLGLYLLLRERHNLRQRELQNELMHIQRLSLMGETASMLAHEINQPLAAAGNYLSALNRLLSNPDTAGSERVAEASQKASDQVGRAARIVQRLRNFIAKKDSERDIESAEQLVGDIQAIYRTLGSSVRLQTEIAPHLPDLSIDRVQVQQVLVNLMRNALEAMQDSSRRELVLIVAPSEAGMVKFCLRDSGPGLSKEVADRLFHPFVTTKADGMGVGLSICRKIVSDHGGRIWAEAAPEGGTVFSFTLPAVEAREAARAA